MFKRVKQVFGIADQETDGSLPFSLVAANTTNATLVKDSPGLVTALHVINVNAAVRYLKFYDTNQKPTAGSGTPIRRYAIPASATGAGFTLTFPTPIKFKTGIAFTLVTGIADTDATAPSANDLLLTGEYV